MRKAAEVKREESKDSKDGSNDGKKKKKKKVSLQFAKLDLLLRFCRADVVFRRSTN